MKNITDKQLAEKISELKETERVVKQNLTALEAELKKRKNKTPLGVPSSKKVKTYYYVTEYGQINVFYDSNDMLDKCFFDIGNYFSSKESAKKHAEMLLAWRKDGLLANSKGEPIDIKVLLPLLKKGWVFYQGNINAWLWSKNKPTLTNIRWEYEAEFYPIHAFNLKPAEDWSKSLMECGLTKH